MADNGVLCRKVKRMNGMQSFGVVVPVMMQYEFIKVAHASKSSFRSQGSPHNLVESKGKVLWAGD